MALTFTTGMTSIDPADSTTNWSSYKITSGGVTPTLNNSTDILVEGTQALSFKPTASKDVGASFDYYTSNSSVVLDMTTAGNEVIGVWLQVTSSATLASFATGGIYIGVMGANATPSSSNAWSKWYVGGSDLHAGGWNYFEVDTRKTPSATNSGGATLSTVYQIFFGTLASSTVPRADSFYIDASWYGRPVYTVIGDDAVTTADWADFLSDSTTNENGLIQDVNGAYELSCGIQIGTNAQVATTDFSDATNQNIHFKRHVYYNAGTVDALTYADYYKVSAEGAAADKTNITLGSLVGSDEGILGGTIRSLDPANVPVVIDFNTDQADINSLNMYGVTFQGIQSTIDLGANSAFKYFSNSFIDCDQVNPNGGCQMRNCLFINTADAVSALIWNNSIDLQTSKFIANTTGSGVEHTDWNGTEDGTVTTADLTGVTLHDTAGTFTGDVVANDVVYNETDNSFALVVTVDSNIQITTDGLLGGSDNDFAGSDAYSITTPYAYTNLTFSGNTTDIDNTIAATNVAGISKAGTSDPTTYPAGDHVAIVGSVAIAITVKDTAGAAIATAQTAIYLTDGTEVMNADTNGSGLASATFAGTTPAACIVKVRKSSTGSTRYIPFSSSQTIAAGDGLTLAVTLREDSNA